MSFEPLRDLARWPILLILSVVERLRRLPGSRLAARLLPWLAGGLMAGGVIVLIGYMSEHSPQRVSIADLAAHRQSSQQHWFIVSGDLQVEQAVPGSYRYTLTDAEHTDAYLIVNSASPLQVGRTTVSGRIEGFLPPLPPGEVWYANLRADEQLAIERPPPYSAMLLALLGVVILAARRSTYPMFVPREPGRAPAATGTRRVVVRPDADHPGDGVTQGRLDLSDTSDVAPNLSFGDGRSVPVRIHSRLTSLRMGELQSLSRREPVIRLLSASGDLYLGFGSREERDAVAAALLYRA
jgi:hypothetical protein